jgi:hypothetical protein
MQVVACHVCYATPFLSPCQLATLGCQERVSVIVRASQAVGLRLVRGRAQLLWRQLGYGDGTRSTGVGHRGACRASDLVAVIASLHFRPVWEPATQSLGYPIGGRCLISLIVRSQQTTAGRTWGRTPADRFLPQVLSLRFAEARGAGRATRLCAVFETCPVVTARLWLDSFGIGLLSGTPGSYWLQDWLQHLAPANPFLRLTPVTTWPPTNCSLEGAKCCN